MLNGNKLSHCPEGVSAPESVYFSLRVDIGMRLRAVDACWCGNSEVDELFNRVRMALGADVGLLKEFFKEYAPLLFNAEVLDKERLWKKLRKRPFREVLLAAAELVSPEAVRLVEGVYNGTETMLTPEGMEAKFLDLMSAMATLHLTATKDKKGGGSGARGGGAMEETMVKKLKLEIEFDVNMGGEAGLPGVTDQEKLANGLLRGLQESPAALYEIYKSGIIEMMREGGYAEEIDEGVRVMDLRDIAGGIAVKCGLAPELRELLGVMLNPPEEGAEGDMRGLASHREVDDFWNNLQDRFPTPAVTGVRFVAGGEWGGGKR